ncbi:MAG: hypothetical protein COU32_00150 [Candidatus Magasanikbacteria bacterium CG10_big_fil_rev_8_21_14_0_10_42_10]|uniref:Uncharacterized protein n=1 Tax=Candidatus Magasanikbacteria bacterium CG10_big_fil_rev_8_21_14_0_10_42_10 TaxID=1974649 RepID=A0A2H0TXC4_9BACT|nr:MAG: hypothetical protein COU32_00150 [Candidatus Magasanikbacteria bacterium CG10_big_fil_rev_8_21_14_0_10_42_10]
MQGLVLLQSFSNLFFFFGIKFVFFFIYFYHFRYFFYIDFSSFFCAVPTNYKCTTFTVLTTRR